jgi:hypothetical protein
MGTGTDLPAQPVPATFTRFLNRLIDGLATD